MRIAFLGSGASFSGTMPGSLTIAGDVMQGFISSVGNYTFQVTGTDGTNTLILTITIEVMETDANTGDYRRDFEWSLPCNDDDYRPPTTHGEAAVMAHFTASAKIGEALMMEFQWDQIKGSDGFTIVGGSLPDGLGAGSRERSDHRCANRNGSLRVPDLGERLARPRLPMGAADRGVGFRMMMFGTELKWNEIEMNHGARRDHRGRLVGDVVWSYR